MTTAVPEGARAAFGVAGEPEVLLGGMAPVYRFGGVVLKEIGDPVETAYLADTMAAVEVDPAVVRVARPVAALEGGWIAHGWSAWSVVEGAQPDGPQPWAAALAASDALHDALRGEQRAPFLDERTHRWAVAERVAWDEQELAVEPRIEEQTARLWPLVARGREAPQLVHGDLCGNLLFHPTLPPAVIDFSPAWAPPSWARAIYAVDALGWHHGDDDLLALVRSDDETMACLARAGIFRLVALDGRVRDLGLDLAELLPEYQRLVDRLVTVLS